jgi:hypothetical protein
VSGIGGNDTVGIGMIAPFYLLVRTDDDRDLVGRELFDELPCVEGGKGY